MEQATCSTAGCAKRAYTRGMCNTHYRAGLKAGTVPGVKFEPCSVLGCDRVAHARELCSMHYGRWWRTGDPNKVRKRHKAQIIDGERECPMCRAWKPLRRFAPHPRATGGRGGYCYDCRANLKRAARYAISVDELAALIARQSGQCKVCTTALVGRNMCVDHCHDSGQVRGLLCTNCNIGIGHFKDDPDLLQKAILYLTG